MNNSNENESKLYEIINPSDCYTFKAPDFKSACIAICILGGGNYGIEEIDNNKGNSMPVFVFGGHDDLMFELIIAEGQKPEIIEGWNIS